MKNLIQLYWIFLFGAFLFGCSHSHDPVRAERSDHIQIKAIVKEVILEAPVIYHRLPLTALPPHDSVQSLAVLKITDGPELYKQQQMRIFFNRSWDEAKFLISKGSILEFSIKKSDLELSICEECEMIDEPYVFSAALLGLKKLTSTSGGYK